ncbi:hypothetical protein KDL01_00680 [Actinospica durhamensis]|uniref:NB-ARC domain-containing protein n=1 Tax=Actinospica durhamensis TaxID=1508375 RepID=A0A941EI12_9ACTN|nr:NB-ARC domain-containing protein [Actinospica durhamensis]MBR7831751.1 hypothetical protein [Actinospica durhamensis]
MSFSATRLTCFALISALEEDLRNEIRANAGPADVERFLSPDRYEKVKTRRAKDHGLHPSPGLSSLLPYLDFADSHELMMKLKKDVPAELREPLAQLDKSMAKLVDIRNRVAHTRPMEIDDLPFVLDLAEEIVRRRSDRWENLATTLEHLSQDPAYVLGLKIDLTTDPDPSPQHNLPVPDFDETGFFGRQKELARIKKAVKGAYPVVSILGDGGVGKTSIALKVAYDLLDDKDQRFDALVWVTAKATVLTVNEIIRINDAIESSLGLFAGAAAQLGAQGSGESMIDEVLSYLEHFKILLILDNLETVLDSRLREFLLDLPLGSKVIVTSRIGLGIENPVSLSPLSVEDSVRLLRALARTRGVRALDRIGQDKAAELVSAMNGHPAYIKWFVSGVQAGRRPEELLSSNDLLLDYCMSNVYEFLTDEAPQILKSMQVLPGIRGQAELAFLNDYSAAKIQTSLLSLLTTNFVQMQTSSIGQSLESSYELTDFGRQYLEKRHPVDAATRTFFLERSRTLMSLGATIRAEASASPYDPRTIDIRGVGDFSVARLLRDALSSHDNGQTDRGLELCREAQRLAPGYYEAWRVEGFIQTERSDYAAALACYERAHELVQGPGPVNFFFGSFLIEEGGDPARGLALLQNSAPADDVHPVVATQIAWAHLQLRDYRAAGERASLALTLRPITPGEAISALTIGLRSIFYEARFQAEQLELSQCLSEVESAVAIAALIRVELLAGEPADRLLQLVELVQDERDKLPDGDPLSTVADELVAKIRDRIRCVEPDLLSRRIGVLKNRVADKYFGFISSWGADYFFHFNDLEQASDWEFLAAGVPVAFFPTARNLRGERAERATTVRWLG